MEGTIREQISKQSGSKKRKSATFDDEGDVSTDNGKSTPENLFSDKKSRMKGGGAIEFTQISHFLDIRDKDRKRGEKRAKLHPAHEFEQIGQFLEAGSKFKGKPPKYSKDPDQSEAHAETSHQSADEAVVRREKAKSGKAATLADMSEKEQRRREKRAAKMAANLSHTKEKTARSSYVGGIQVADSQTESPAPATADEALRRAERKRRKEQKRLSKMDA